MKNTAKKILLSSLVVSSMAMGAETAFVTHVELGYVETKGNTETQTFVLDASAKKSIDKHQFSLSLDGQYATNNEIETKNKYTTELNYDYAFTERFSFGYLLGYKDDKFSGYDYQLYTGPGAKYKVVKTESQDLSFEANILYSVDKQTDVNYDATGAVIAYPNPANIATASKVTTDANDYAAYRLKVVYALEIAKDLNFGEEISFRGDFEDSNNYFAYSKTSLKSKLSDIFSAGLSYKVDYAHIPAQGKENRDKTLTANLIIDF